ncbi:MAG: helix-turn-helix domain-containing protein [Erysipelotrichales bacterium]|nr:helix-turn-helix domain-containing protein [Erysipelotrichales bacterium]
MKYKQKFSTVLKDVLAERIKKERELRNFTQEKLTSGICSQSQLSRLEQGIDIPNTISLIGICDKLDISLKYLIDENQTDWDRVLADFENKAEEYIAFKNLKELENLIARHDFFRDSEDLDIVHKQYYRYTLGAYYVLRYEILTPEEKAGSQGAFYLAQAEIILVDAIDFCNYKTAFVISLKLKIFNYLGVIYYWSNMSQQALKFYKTIEKDLHLLDTLKYARILATYYYYMAWCYKSTNANKHLTYLEDGIKLCLRTRCVHTLDALYYSKFCTYLNKDGKPSSEKYSEAISTLDKAMAIAELFDNQNFLSFLKEVKNQL